MDASCIREKGPVLCFELVMTAGADFTRLPVTRSTAEERGGSGAARKHRG